MKTRKLLANSPRLTSVHPETDMSSYIITQDRWMGNEEREEILTQPNVIIRLDLVRIALVGASRRPAGGRAESLNRRLPLLVQPNASLWSDE